MTDSPGRVVYPRPRLVLEARGADAAVGRSHLLRPFHRRGAARGD